MISTLEIAQTSKRVQKYLALKFNNDCFIGERHCYTLMANWLEELLYALQYQCLLHNTFYQEEFTDILYHLIDTYVVGAKETPQKNMKLYTKQFISSCSVKSKSIPSFFDNLVLKEIADMSNDCYIEDIEIIELGYVLHENSSSDRYFSPSDWENSLQAFLQDLDIEVERGERYYSNFVAHNVATPLILLHHSIDREVMSVPVTLVDEFTIYFLYPDQPTNLPRYTLTKDGISYTIIDDTINAYRAIETLLSVNLSQSYYNHIQTMQSLINANVTLQQELTQNCLLSSLIPTPKFICKYQFNNNFIILQKFEDAHKLQEGYLLLAKDDFLDWVTLDSLYAQGIGCKQVAQTGATHPPSYKTTLSSFTTNLTTHVWFLNYENYYYKEGTTQNTTPSSSSLNWYIVRLS